MMNKDKYPNSMREEETVEIFKRIFKNHEVYINPLRTDKIKKEKRKLVDILIVTDNVMIFVHFKDNSNTSDGLKCSMARKRKTIRNHIKKATNQLRGALNYVRGCDDVTILFDKKSVTIKSSKKQLIGLIIVRELLDDDFLECSALVLNLVRKINLGIILLDYPQLHILSKNLITLERFFGSFHDSLMTALKKGRFTSCIFSGNDGILVDIEKQETDDFFQHDDGYWKISHNEVNQLRAGIRNISKTRYKYKEAGFESQMPFEDFYKLMKVREKELEDDDKTDEDCAEFYLRFLNTLNNLNTSEIQNRIMYFIGGIYVRVWNVVSLKYSVTKPYAIKFNKDKFLVVSEKELNEYIQQWNKNNTFYYIETQDNKCRSYYY